MFFLDQISEWLKYLELINQFKLSLKEMQGKNGIRYKV